MNGAIQELTGVERVRSYLVTSRDILAFAQAIGAKPPQAGEDGSLLAPPLFCQVFMFDPVPVHELPADGSPKELDLPIPAKRAVGGGSDYRILGPVRSGDRITVRSWLREVSTKEGKAGTLYFVVVETRFENQRGEPVAHELATYVKRD